MTNRLITKINAKQLAVYLGSCILTGTFVLIYDNVFFLIRLYIQVRHRCALQAWPQKYKKVHWTYLCTAGFMKIHPIACVMTKGKKSKQYCLLI